MFIQTVLFTAALLLCLSIPIVAQSDTDLAGPHRIEVEWLTRNLNNEKLTDIKPTFNADAASLGLRRELTAALGASAAQPREVKVRIRGTITLLTGDAARDRSFEF